MRSGVLLFLRGMGIIIGLACFRCDVLADEVLKEWRAKAPEGWSRLSGAYSQVDVLAHFVSHSNKNTDLPEKQTQRYRRNGKHRLLEVTRSVDTTRTQSVVFACNSDYAFKLLSRGSPGSSGDWVIDAASRGYLSQRVPQTAIDGLSYRVYECPWTIFSVGSLPQMMASDALQVNEISLDDATDSLPQRVTLRLAYEAPPDDLATVMSAAFARSENRSPPKVSGTVVLAPDWDWAILSYDLTAVDEADDKRNYAISANIDYTRHPHPDGRDIVVPGSFQAGIIRDGQKVDLSCAVDSWEFGNVDVSEFTLPAYGLPEVVLTPSTPQSSVGWRLMLAAASLLLFSLLAGWVARRGSHKKGGQAQ